MLNGFQRRAQEPELMDLPNPDPARLLRTVRQFKWTNLLFSRSRTILKQQVLNKSALGFSILDVGAGGGDIMRWLVIEARRRGIAARVVCLDYDERISAFADARCASYPEISVRTGDIHDLGEGERFDFVFCNNFLHHFSDAAIPAVLKKMGTLADRGLIVNDIHRSKAAYYGYGAFAALFFHRSFARSDGMLSIRKGFAAAELRILATQAALDSESKVEIVPLNPSRLILLALDRQDRHGTATPQFIRKGVSQ